LPNCSKKSTKCLQNKRFLQISGKGRKYMSSPFCFQSINIYLYGLLAGIGVCADEILAGGCIAVFYAVMCVYRLASFSASSSASLISGFFSKIQPLRQK
jgi:hypothetical protein